MDSELKEYLEHQFKSIRSEMATKEDLTKMATKDDIKAIRVDINLLQFLLRSLQQDLRLYRVIMRSEIKNITPEIAGNVNQRMEFLKKYIGFLDEAMQYKLDTIVKGHQNIQN